MIEKRFCKIFEKIYSPDDEKNGSQYMINGLLGIINISGYNFVVGITEKQHIAKVDGANIYLVKRVEILPFQEEVFNQI